jgi:hypothetical protein
MTVHPRPSLGQTPVYGQCFECGAIAWELLEGKSVYCMACDLQAYQVEDDDPCARCDCQNDGDCYL